MLLKELTFLFLLIIIKYPDKFFFCEISLFILTFEVRVRVVSVASYPLVFEESVLVVPAVSSAFVVPAVLSAYDVPAVLSVYVVQAVLSVYVVQAALSVFVVLAVWAAAGLAVGTTGALVFAAYPVMQIGASVFVEHPVSLTGELEVTVLTVADPVNIQKIWDYINICLRQLCTLIYRNSRSFCRRRDKVHI